MRVSEKTIEINFCAEASVLLRPRYRLIWFGLSQKQEARFGFDTCARLGGIFLFFQFKASNHVLRRSGQRKFLTHHAQMQNLQRLAQTRPNSVFYVFPGFGNTREFLPITDLLSFCYLVDVTHFPDPVPAPGRASGYHNAYLSHAHDSVEFRSRPFIAKAMPARTLFSEIANEHVSINMGIPAEEFETKLHTEIMVKRRTGLFALGIIPI